MTYLQRWYAKRPGEPVKRCASEGEALAVGGAVVRFDCERQARDEGVVHLRWTPNVVAP